MQINPKRVAFLVLVFVLWYFAPTEGSAQVIEGAMGQFPVDDPVAMTGTVGASTVPIRRSDMENVVMLVALAVVAVVGFAVGLIRSNRSGRGSTSHVFKNGASE